MPLARGADDDTTLPVRVRFTPGSIVRAVLIVMGFIVLAQVVGAASEPLIWFAEGVTGAALLYPVVLILSRKMPHWVAVALVSVGLVLFVALVGFRLFTELKDEALEFQSQAPTIAQNVESSSTVGEAAQQFELGEKIIRFANDVAGAFTFDDASVTTLSTAASIGSALFVIWLFGVMMLFSAPTFIGGAERQVRDEERRDRAREVLATAYLKAWQYFSLSTVRALGYGVATWLVAWSTGLQAPTLLSVWVALWSFVPGIGLICGAVLVSIVGMFSSFSLAGALFLGFVVVQLLDVHFVQRRIDRETVHIGPAVTMVAAMIGFGLAGFGGVILACSWLFFTAAVLDQLRPSSAVPPAVDGGPLDPAPPSPGAQATPIPP